MDIPYLKAVFVSEYGFLKDLYNGNPRQNTKKIEFASDQSLDTLCKIIHLVLNGAIVIRKEDLTCLKKSKRLNILRHFFESKVSFLKVIKSNKLEKVNVLKKFSALYPSILYTMFNLV